MQKTETLTFPSRGGWIEARRTFGIGSSDAPAILGLSRYQSAFGLYSEKLGLQSPDRSQEEIIQWGNILEEPIAQRYALETGRSVRNPRPPDGSFTIQRSLDKPFMLCSVDRFTIAKPEEAAASPVMALAEGVLEIKNAHLFMAADWLDLQEPPAEFQVQLQHQLAVTGAPWGSIACLIGGSKFVWKDIARDEEFIELLIAKEQEFWNRLVNRTPPPIDGSEMTRAVIGRLHPKDNGQVIELPPEAAETIAALEALKKTGKMVDEQRTKLENELKALIGDNTAGTLRDGTVATWKWQKRASYVAKETEFRQLRIAVAKTRPEVARS